MLARKNIAAVALRQLPTSWFLSSLPSRSRSTTAINPEATAKPFSEIPGPSGLASLPFVGIFFLVKSKFSPGTFYNLLDEQHEKFGRTFKMQLVGEVVVTEDPDAIAEIYRHEGKYPMRNPINIIETYGKRHNREPGVGMLEGERWQRLRSASQKFLLRKTSASIYVKSQAEVAEDLVTRMNTLKYTPAEFRYELFRYATESLGTVVFRKRLGFLDPSGSPLTERNTKYLKSLMDFFEFIMADFGPTLYKWLPTKFYRDFKKLADIAYGYGEEELENLLTRIDTETQNGTYDNSIPCLILQLQTDKRLNERSINAICLDLILAGTDSTAKNMDNFLLNMALNPEKQEKLYSEVADVIGTKGSSHNGDHMDAMPYYRACMKESFRLLYPISMGAARRLAEDAVIDGYLVPKGTLMMMNNRRLVLNENYFEKPLEYLPERWLRNDQNKTESQYPPFAHLPFSFGARNCIGRRFAEQEVWLGVTKILQNFRVSAPGKVTDYEMFYKGFGQTSHPVKFTFTAR